MVWRCASKWAFSLLVVLSCGKSYAQIASISQIQATANGTTVTLAGAAAGWKDSWKESAPNTFFLTDATGSIRVCIWPDDLAEVAPPVLEQLKKKGTPVRLKGEIKVFRDKPEVHVKDGGTVNLLSGATPVGAAPNAATSASLPVATLSPAR